MVRRLSFDDRAADEIRAALRWWAEHREAAPTLLSRELREAMARLRENFDSAQPVEQRNGEVSVRGIVLKRSGYKLYARLGPDDDERIDVLSLWHMSRGRGPLED